MVLVLVAVLGYLVLPLFCATSLFQPSVFMAMNPAPIGQYETNAKRRRARPSSAPADGEAPSIVYRLSTSRPPGPVARTPEGLPDDIWVAICDFTGQKALSHVCRRLWSLLQKRHHALCLRGDRLPQWVEWCGDQVPSPAPD